MSKFLKDAGEKGSAAVPLGNRAALISRVRNSSFISSTGNFGSSTAVFEKKPPNMPVCGFDDGCEEVGRFCSTGRSGETDLEEVEDGSSGSVFSPKGNDIGVDDPVNQELSPPLDLSATFITPSLSPVKVGMNSVSMSALVGL